MVGDIGRKDRVRGRLDGKEGDVEEKMRRAE